MTRIARLADIVRSGDALVSGRVAYAPVVLPEGVAITDAFPPELAEQHVPCPDVAVGAGWTYAVGADGTASFTAPVAAAATAAQLIAYASARQNAVLAGAWSFNVSASGVPAHVVTTKLDQGGQFAMLKIDVWAQTNAANAGASLPYSNIDFSATTLNPAEASALALQAGAVDAQSYAILNQVVAGAQASPPTITATAQIDAAFAVLAPAA